MKRRLLPFLLLIAACSPPQPTLILLPDTPIGEGGRILRDLYRSAWDFPASDRSTIRIGLLIEKKSLRFQAKQAMKIRAYSESGSWEVASPAGVLWSVESTGQDRPPHISYFATVDSLLLHFDEHPKNEALHYWAARGYPSVRWIGPPNNDVSSEKETFQRWFLSLTPPTGEKTAASICKGARERTEKECTVITRVELPPMARGILRAENSTFERPFSGLLELLSPRGPVAVFDMVLEERTGERSVELYGPRLFVAPEINGTLSMVQSTSFGNYLKGVVPAEIYPTAPMEALKAQAVVARTYTLRTATPNTQNPFFICASTHCQVYRGEGFKKDETSRAVDESNGLILQTNEKTLAETFYHAICGGHTEPKRLIWGPPEASYLHGVVDQPLETQWKNLSSDEAVARWLRSPPLSYCGKVAANLRPDRWRWESKLDRPQIEQLFRESGLSSPRDIRVTRRGVSGRVLEMELIAQRGRRKIHGELEIRKKLGGLLSSLFILEISHDATGPQEVTIRGGAYGHGVGLCQMGAIGRAEAGQSFREILGAYYPGTHVEPLGESPAGVVLK